MTLRTWVGRPLVLVAVAALILVWMPVERVFANEVAPETKSETLTELPVESSEVVEVPDDAISEASNSDGDAVVEDDEEEVPEADAETEDGHARDADGADEEAPEEGVVRERSEVIETPLPFSGLGFSGPGSESPTVHWRALEENGQWSGWQLVEPMDEFDGPDPGTVEEQAASAGDERWASDALWVGSATHLQVQVEGASLDSLDITVIDSAGLSESLAAKAKRTLMSLGTQQQSAEASPGQPSIIPRSQWLGSSATCDSGSISNRTVRAAVLHHTVTNNTYSEAEAPQQVRNMYHYHACTLGWADLGYNFVVDRFGNIYEGRRGGITKGIQGAHAAGWNSGTFGVALMGNHNTATPSPAALDSAAALINWKYDVHNIDPSASATTTLNSQTIPTLVGHRNVRGSYTKNPSTTTDCPGQLLYTRMDELRDDIAAGGSSWVPVVGDWNGDGRTTTGWFRNGLWNLRNANSSGDANLSFYYGTQGDLPVVGDWNGDGRTTVGIVRDGQWLLRDSNTRGRADHNFWYGRGAIDYPMAGDWNGNGKDTPGIVRDGAWHLRNSLSNGDGEISFYYGRVTQGDIPVVGDWLGVGRDLPGVLRDGTWHLRYTYAGGHSDREFIYGRVSQGDFPIVGDWNRSGTVTPGVVREDTWYLRNSLSGGSADTVFQFR